MRVDDSAIVIGAGAGGLAAALALASAGISVTVLERASSAGGKIRAARVGDSAVDIGPTVFTMRWAFDELFRDAGFRLDDFITLDRAHVLARHAWVTGGNLDLYASVEQSADAIGRFAGAADARGYLAFAARARSIYRTLEGAFIRRACSSPLDLIGAVGLHRLAELWRITPFVTLWRALGSYFKDPRLRQLFGRYATYCGSSPFAAPATLMLVAHVEQDGVWFVRGGMQALVKALERACLRCGVTFRFASEVTRIDAKDGRVAGVTLADGERIGATRVIVNADSAAVSTGRFGTQAAAAVPPVAAATRSLSAMTWAFAARCDGFDLEHHNVFFSSDYRREFSEIFGHSQVPQEPTVYVCAQDGGGSSASRAEKNLFCLINAPPDGDSHTYSAAEIDECNRRMMQALTRCGLTLHPTADQPTVTTPTDFDRLFPSTGGALYGPASHGFMASFRRPAARTKLAGLYLAGGSVHPGPGVPMAVLSGRLAAATVLADLHSIGTSRPVAIAGGTSMR